MTLLSGKQPNLPKDPKGHTQRMSFGREHLTSEAQSTHCTDTGLSILGNLSVNLPLLIFTRIQQPTTTARGTSPQWRTFHWIKRSVDNKVLICMPTRVISCCRVTALSFVVGLLQCVKAWSSECTIMSVFTILWTLITASRPLCASFAHCSSGSAVFCAGFYRAACNADAV